jgi:hypothetical protein
MPGPSRQVGTVVNLLGRPSNCTFSDRTAPGIICGMDDFALRHQFSRFAGHEKFRDFVRALNWAPIELKRLRFWQQQLWDSFVQANPQWPSDFSHAREAFRICEVHRQSLIRDKVWGAGAPSNETQSPDMRRPNTPCEFIMFPYPGWGLDPAKWPDGYLKLIEIWYCPECRSRRAEWEAEHQAVSD